MKTTAIDKNLLNAVKTGSSFKRNNLVVEPINFTYNNTKISSRTNIYFESVRIAKITESEVELYCQTCPNGFVAKRLNAICKEFTDANVSLMGGRLLIRRPHRHRAITFAWYQMGVGHNSHLIIRRTAK